MEIFKDHPTDPGRETVGNRGGPWMNLEDGGSWPRSQGRWDIGR